MNCTRSSKKLREGRILVVIDSDVSFSLWTRLSCGSCAHKMRWCDSRFFFPQLKTAHQTLCLHRLIANQRHTQHGSCTIIACRSQEIYMAKIWLPLPWRHTWLGVVNISSCGLFAAQEVMETRMMYKPLWAGAACMWTGKQDKGLIDSVSRNSSKHKGSEHHCKLCNTRRWLHIDLQSFVCSLTLKTHPLCFMSILYKWCTLTTGWHFTTGRVLGKRLPRIHCGQLNYCRPKNQLPNWKSLWRVIIGCFSNQWLFCQVI